MSTVEFFKSNGYMLIKRPVLPLAEFDALKAHFEAKLRRWEADGKGAAEHMDRPHFEDPALFRWLFADAILDLVEPLIGPDIALWSSHFICKPAGVGKRVPWHEDSAYYGKSLQPMELVTVWLALDPSGPDNGGMRVIPGTHRNGYSDYEPVANPAQQVSGTEIRKGAVDDARAVNFELQPNQCSIHHVKLIHGSEYNTSTRRRCGLTMRYFPTTTKFHPECRKDQRTLHQVYLARGRDRAGNTYGDPSRVFDAWMNASATERSADKALAH